MEGGMGILLTVGMLLNIFWAIACLGRLFPPNTARFVDMPRSWTWRKFSQYKGGWFFLLTVVLLGLYFGAKGVYLFVFLFYQIFLTSYSVEVFRKDWLGKDF